MISSCFRVCGRLTAVTSASWPPNRRPGVRPGVRARRRRRRERPTVPAPRNGDRWRDEAAGPCRSPQKAARAVETGSETIARTSGAGEDSRLARSRSRLGNHDGQTRPPPSARSE
jgi:hypothetical protein